MKRWIAALAMVVGLSCGRSGDIIVAEGILVNSQIVDAAANVGMYADLEINALDQVPRIAYYDFTNGDLKYAELNMNNGEWQVSVIDQEGDVGGFVDLEFTQTGVPHIAYYDFTNARIKYAFFNGLEWEIAPLPIAAEFEGYLAMKVDRNDVAHLAAITTGRFDLDFFTWDPINRVYFGLTVDNGTLTTGRGGNINREVSMQLRRVGGEDLPVISYYQASHGLLQIAWLERQTDGSLGFETRVLDGAIIAGAADVGQWVASWLETDANLADNQPDDDPSNDVLHLSYYDSTNQDLRYARYDWARDEVIRERVDDNGVVGETSSITVMSGRAADGTTIRPVITYFDSTNNDLKLAVRVDAGRWQKYRVDLRGVVGSFSSVRVLRDGSLGVAYHDSNREALKFSTVRTN